MKNEKNKFRHDLILIAALLVIAGILYFVFQSEKSGGAQGPAEASSAGENVQEQAPSGETDEETQDTPAAPADADKDGDSSSEGGPDQAADAGRTPDSGEAAGSDGTADSDGAGDLDTKTGSDTQIRGEVVVYHGNEVIGRYPLAEDGVFVLNDGTNEMTIKDGYAWMSEAHCPDGLCKSMGEIHYNGDLVVCLPNQIFFTVEGGDDYQFDGVAR